MELKLERQPFCCWETVASGEVSCPLQADMAVQPRDAEAQQLYEDSAVVTVESAVAARGRAEVSGAVLLKAAYRCSRGELHAADARMPFTAALEDARIEPGDAVITGPVTVQREVRLTNGGRLSAACRAEVSVTVLRRVELPLCVGVANSEETGARTLTVRESVEAICTVEERTFTLEDSFELDMEKGGAEELLRTSARLSVEDCREAGSKLIFKGSLEVQCLYRSFDGGEETASFRLPFSRVVETDAPEGSDCTVTLGLSDFSLEPSADSFYEGRTLELRAGVRALVLCSCRRQLEYVKDIYSTRFPLELTFGEARPGKSAFSYLLSASADAGAPLDKSAMPAFVVRRTEPGQPLWELAKQYSADAGAIAAANGLSGQTSPGGMLVIPVV